MKITQNDYKNLKYVTIKDISNVEKLLTKEEFLNFIEKTFLENKENILKNTGYSSIDLKIDSLNNYILNNVFQYLNIEILNINTLNSNGVLTEEIKNFLKKKINDKIKKEVINNEKNIVNKVINLNKENLFDDVEKTALINRLKEIEPIILRDVILKEKNKEYKYDITINKNLDISLSFLTIKDLTLTSSELSYS